MVYVIINELNDTLTVLCEGPYSAVGELENHNYTYSKVNSYFDDMYDRWILENKLELHDYEHKPIFDFPRNEVYIRYIRQ